MFEAGKEDDQLANFLCPASASHFRCPVMLALATYKLNVISVEPTVVIDFIPNYQVQCLCVSMCA